MYVLYLRKMVFHDIMAHCTQLIQLIVHAERDRDSSDRRRRGKGINTVILSIRIVRIFLRIVHRL